MLLRKLQENWQQGVFEEDVNPLMQHIINPEERAVIYIDSYRARLIEALEKTFLLLREKLGDEDFCELALDYVNTHPSEYYTLSRFGKDLGTFLKQAGKHDLAEKAELDWAISQAIDAGNSAIVTRADLQAITPEQLEQCQITFHPSLKLLEKIRVYRKQCQVYYVEFAAHEKNMIQLLQKGHTLGEICEKLGQTLSEDEVATMLIQCLSRWVDDELISAMTVKETA